jgi:hypothetical protein
MIVHRGKFGVTGEVWFDEDPRDSRVDVVRYVQRTEPVNGARCEDFHTMLVDLTLDADTIMGRIAQNTRYKIRRAGEKDGVSCVAWHLDSRNHVGRFCDYYDAFAAQKGRPSVDRHYVERLAEAGVLDLSCAVDQAGTELVWHAYYRTESRARLLYSCSQFRSADDSGARNMIGRANRFHHCEDILRFKREGVSVYDLGGWYTGTEDEERLGINRFKEEFGGEIVRNYNCEKVVSVRGWMFSAARRLLKHG